MLLALVVAAVFRVVEAVRRILRRRAQRLALRTPSFPVILPDELEVSDSELGIAAALEDETPSRHVSLEISLPHMHVPAVDNSRPTTVEVRRAA